MSTSYDRMRPRSAVTLRVETLLDRYPNLNEQQLSELINIFPSLNLLDQGMMTADVRLASKLAAFHRDHGRQLKAPANALVALLAFPLIIVAGALWWTLF